MEVLYKVEMRSHATLNTTDSLDCTVGAVTLYNFAVTFPNFVIATIISNYSV
jgi:hypothetical protein